MSFLEKVNRIFAEVMSEYTPRTPNYSYWKDPKGMKCILYYSDIWKIAKAAKGIEGRTWRI